MNKKLMTITIAALFAGTLAAQDSNTPNPDGNSDRYGRDTRGQTNRSFRNAPATGTNSRPGYGRYTRGQSDRNRDGQRYNGRNDGSGRRNQYGRDTRGHRGNNGQRWQSRRSSQSWNKHGNRRYANLTPQQRTQVRRIRMQTKSGQLSRQEARRRIRLITGRDGFQGRRNNRWQNGRGFQGRRDRQNGRRMQGRRNWNRDGQGRDNRDNRDNGSDD
jgi:hypothetical protein